MKQAWSWSRLHLFEQCPKKYFLQNVAKAPNFKFQPNKATERGERIHKLFEDAAKNIVAIKEATPGTDTMPDPAYPEEIYRYIKTLYKLIGKADDIIIENKTAKDVDGDTVPYFSSKTWLRYAMDFGVRIGDKAILLDWKTGKNWGATDQLKLMAVIAMRYMWPEVNTISSYYVFVDQNETVKETYHRKDLDSMWADFMERVDNLQEAYNHSDFPACANRFCRNCPATKEQCEEKR